MNEPLNLFVFSKFARCRKDACATCSANEAVQGHRIIELRKSGTPDAPTSTREDSAMNSCGVCVFDRRSVENRALHLIPENHEAEACVNFVNV